MDSERDVALAMYRAVDTHPVRAFDPSAVRQRAARRSPVFALAAAAVAASVVAIVALAIGLRAPSDEPLASASCPLPALGIVDWPDGVRRGPADRMVSDGPDSAVVCRYGGDGPRAPQAVEITGDRLRQLVAAVNALPATPPTSPTPECPLDSVGLFNVVFGYADGHTEVVAINPDGCREAFNGTRQSRFVPADVATLLDWTMSS